MSIALALVQDVPPSALQWRLKVDFPQGNNKVSVTKGKARSKVEPGVTITDPKLAFFNCPGCSGMCQSKGIPLGNTNPEDSDYMKCCVASAYHFISNTLICAISLEDAAA